MLEHHLKMSEIREAAVRFSRSRSAHTNTNILRAVACVVGGASKCEQTLVLLSGIKAERASMVRNFKGLTSFFKFDCGEGQQGRWIRSLVLDRK